MIIKIQRGDIEYSVDLDMGMDISLPITDDPDATRAWYIDEPKIEPVKLGDWIGDVKKGSGVNFYNIQFNPHAHGTHTETAGHVLSERHSINKNLNRYFFWAELVTMTPKKMDDDLVMDLELIKACVKHSTEVPAKFLCGALSLMCPFALASNLDGRSEREQ